MDATQIGFPSLFTPLCLGNVKHDSRRNIDEPMFHRNWIYYKLSTVFGESFSIRRFLKSPAQLAMYCEFVTLDLLVDILANEAFGEE